MCVVQGHLQGHDGNQQWRSAPAQTGKVLDASQSSSQRRKLCWLPRAHSMHTGCTLVLAPTPVLQLLRVLQVLCICRQFMHSLLFCSGL